ncbi:Kelch-like protein 17 [Nymphon striatum]|nr:Kelch-like protein 17 [Nymphon striatum]
MELVLDTPVCGIGEQWGRRVRSLSNVNKLDEQLKDNPFNDMQEKHKPVVVLHGIDPTAARILIDFAYSGEISITEDNVQVLLPAANILQMFDIQKACCEFLTKQLDPTNCLGIRKFADVHSCSSLLSTANGFALLHFAKVTETEEFLNLTANEIMQIITNDNINVSSEDEVYRACINWIKFDINSREQFLSKQLLNCVRFPLMTKDSLMDIVANEPLLRLNHELKDLLIEAMTYHLVPEKRSINQNIRMTERVSKNLKPYLFVLGGSSVFSVQDDCECFNPRLNKWLRVAPMLNRRTRGGIATTGKKLYVIGGYNGLSDVSSAEAYDPVKNCWSAVVPMCTKRSCVGVCSLNGLIYASGGYNGASCIDSVERFDPLSNNWTSISAMTAKRRYHKLVAMKGCLYAVGGFDGTNYLSSVEKFDPTLGRWEVVASMSSKRSGPGVAICYGKIYVTGGIDGGVSLASGECYDPIRNSWKPIASLQTRRGTHELVEMDGYLYAIGGNDGSSSLSSIERYDPRLDQWRTDMCLKTRRASVAAAAFKCDPQTERFLHTKENKIQSDI